MNFAVLWNQAEGMHPGLVSSKMGYVTMGKKLPIILDSRLEIEINISTK